MAISSNSFGKLSELIKLERKEISSIYFCNTQWSCTTKLTPGHTGHYWLCIGSHYGYLCLCIDIFCSARHTGGGDFKYLPDENY